MRMLVCGMCHMTIAISLAAQTVEPGATLLFVGEEFTSEEVPPTAAGEWWVLYPAGGSSRLARATVVIDVFHDPCVDEAPTKASGRRVEVPGYDSVIALMRGVPGLAPGPIASASLSPMRAGLAGAVEVVWSGGRSVINGVTAGDGYRVVLLTGTSADTLYSTEWQDEGSWRVRWAGDLNRDGRLDVLLDATHKYSVATQRLFLSAAEGLHEVATFTHTAY